jgi:hypothetical protein
MKINSDDYMDSQDGLQLYAGSAETTETGERIFVCSAAAIGYARADGSEVVAQAAGAIGIAKGLGTRAIAYVSGSQARAVSIGAIALAINGGIATADNGGVIALAIADNGARA